MTHRTRTLATLALVGTLAWGSATLAQRGNLEVPPAPTGPTPPFVRAGNAILNVSRIDFIEIHKAEGSPWLAVYVGGRPSESIRLRARDSADLLRALGLPPLDGPKADPARPAGNQP